MRGDSTAHRTTTEGGTADAGRAEGLWSERYDLIDAWRGLAALAVCVTHVANIHIGGPAVMLFFVISGYCIAASADSCRRKGLGFVTFMRRRVRRIYPPYLLAVAFWAATRVIKWQQTGVNDLARFDWVDWVQNLTMTQWVTLLGHPETGAQNNPTLFVTAFWSICYEEQFYLIMGLMVLAAGFVRAPIVGVTAAVGVVGLAWNIVFPQTAYGLFIEYWALFAIGVLVFHRLCRFGSFGLRRGVDLFLVALLATTVYVRWFAGLEWAADNAAFNGAERASHRVVYEELAIASAFALTLIALRPINATISRAMAYKPLTWLGQITFSLYLIHQFNLTLCERAAGKILSVIPGLRGASPAPEAAWYGLCLQILLHIALASVFWFFCERPFLNKPLTKNPERAGAGVSGHASRPVPRTP